MALDKKKKVSSDGLSTKEKMLARKKQLESKGNGNGLVFPKEGTLRMRIKSPGDDQELGIEIVQFYLGGNLGGVISPATFDEPCPFMEKYQELKNSKDEDDKELAKLSYQEEDTLLVVRSMQTKRELNLITRVKIREF